MEVTFNIRVTEMLPLVKLNFPIGHIEAIKKNCQHSSQIWLSRSPHLFCLVKSICNLLTQHLKNCMNRKSKYNKKAYLCCQIDPHFRKWCQLDVFILYFGVKCVPSSFNVSSSYRSTRCFQSMLLPLHYRDIPVYELKHTYVIFITYQKLPFSLYQLFQIVFQRCGESKMKYRNLLPSEA